ncbi:GNAT family N-acetyltransferase [Kitasatospora sp. NPDC051853]|uniref:GNAT family N-acetyltransferase n=1 Tax=Kitasatospora sp. NPDC051853 TaxID=3364058 RepID=UPI0037AD2895
MAVGSLVRRVFGPRCGGGRHVIRTARLDLFTPVIRLDAAACIGVLVDAGAQRWNGLVWEEGTMGAAAAAQLLSFGTGRRSEAVRQWPQARLGERLAADQVDGGQLVAVHRADRRYAGEVAFDPETGQIGGTLAPWYRYRGLGTELFAAGAELAHRHLGVASVGAGAEVGNRPSRRSLEAAGFTPAGGPARHVLPDGREVDSSWYEHRSEHPRRC